MSSEMNGIANYSEPPFNIGVDVGGTKILAALVDNQGRLLSRISHPTDISNQERTLASIAETIEHAIQSSGYPKELVNAIGLGIPGLIDPLEGVGIASVNLKWRDAPVKAALENRLGLPCAIENDVKVAALAEARYGAGRGFQNLVYVSIGTGIAAAVLLDNTLYRGPNGMAGEIGHAVLDLNGPLCKCSGRGCFEALASGPAIALRAVHKLRANSASMLSQVQGELTAEDVFSAVEKGDRLAMETASEVGAYVAQALQFLALAYDSRLVILGGGVPMAGTPFIDPVRQALERMAEQNWVFGAIYHPDFLQVTRLGRDIGILGAAALVSTPMRAVDR
jgi:glucokinase